MPKLSIVAAMLLFVSYASARGQEANSKQPFQYLPEETVAVVSLWPQQLAASPRMRLAPLEVLSASGMENFGVDPLKLKRVDIVLGDIMQPTPRVGALVHASEPIDIKNLNPEIFDENVLTNEDGFEYMTVSRDLFSPELIIHQLDSQTAIVGSKDFVMAMLRAADDQGDVAAVMASVKSQQDALAIVSIRAVRPMLLQVLAQGIPLPAEILGDINTIVERTELLALRVLVGNEEKLQLVISTQNEDSATEVDASLQSSLEFAQNQIIGQMKREIPVETATGAAMHAYFDRVGGQVLALLKPKQAGNRLVIEFDDFQNTAIIGTLTGLLLPAVQSARGAAQRMQSSNNLKQLALALHNFESAYRSFPATAGLDDQGEPMISWRVAILPFIEEAALYQKFNLDEPWDSEHNLALLEEMPEVFKHPGRATPPGHTVYQAPVGEETLLRLKEPSRFADITDGTSNTIMLVETTAARAVPWTAPQDYEVDVADPAAGLFEGEVGNFVFGDGSVRSIARSIEARILNALFTRAGGEVVDVP